MWTATRIEKNLLHGQGNHLPPFCRIRRMLVHRNGGRDDPAVKNGTCCCPVATDRKAAAGRKSNREEGKLGREWNWQSVGNKGRKKVTIDFLDLSGIERECYKWYRGSGGLKETEMVQKGELEVVGRQTVARVGTAGASKKWGKYTQSLWSILSTPS